MLQLVARLLTGAVAAGGALLLLGSTATGTFPGRNGSHIAFYGDEGGRVGVFLMQRDGTHQHRLTPVTQFSRTPAFSPNGKLIAFDGEPLATGDQVEVMRLDGSHVRDLTPTPNENDWPTWSPNGKRIAFRRDSNIALMRADGTHIHKISHGYFDLQPTWSPNGKRIAFDSEPSSGPGQIAIINTDGTHQHAITHDATSDFGPDFSPSGKLIAFTHSVGTTTPDRLVTIRPDGTHRHVLIKNGRYPAFSPNGKLILFSRYDGHYDQLFTAHVDGTHIHQLTHNNFNHDGGVWQPRPQP